MSVSEKLKNEHILELKYDWNSNKVKDTQTLGTFVLTFKGYVGLFCGLAFIFLIITRLCSSYVKQTNATNIRAKMTGLN